MGAWWATDLLTQEQRDYLRRLESDGIDPESILMLASELVKATGKSRSELQFRMRFAERYFTEDEVCNALDTYTSWFQVTQNLPKPHSPLAPTEANGAKGQCIGHLQVLKTPVARMKEGGNGWTAEGTTGNGCRSHG
jgi:hypothetical protein